MEATGWPIGRERGRGLGMPYGRLGDEALARLVRQGTGERPFATLYERYRGPIHGYCRTILQDDTDAQDAVQTTFTSAFRALREGRRDAPLRPWLYRIAHNAAVSVIRRRRWHGELDEAVAASSFELADHAAERERLDQLLRDLRALPERQRSALVMRELSGLSHRDIASALGTSVATAKQAIFEARRSLDDFSEGRAMTCDDICRLLSDGDRRAVRSRRVAAHLRACPDCERFAASMTERSRDLRAFAPAALPATAMLLQHVLGRRAAGSGSAAASGSGSVGAGVVGKSAALIAGSAKLGAGAALVATVALGTIETVARVPPPPAHHHAVRAGSRSAVRSGSSSGLVVGNKGRTVVSQHRGGRRSGSVSGSAATGRGPHAAGHGRHTLLAGAAAANYAQHSSSTGHRVGAGRGRSGSPPGRVVGHAPGSPSSHGANRGRGGPSGGPPKGGPSASGGSRAQSGPPPGTWGGANSRGHLGSAPGHIGPAPRKAGSSLRQAASILGRITPPNPPGFARRHSS